MKKVNKVLTVILAVLVAVGLFFGGYFTNELIKDEYEELNWVISQINKHYLVYDEETGEVKNLSEEDYIKILISGLKADGYLDSYSNYYNEEEYTDVVLSSKGNSYGTGIGFYKTDLVIGKVKYNSPMYKASNGADLTGKKVTGISSVEETSQTALSDYAHYSQELAKYSNSVMFKIYVDNQPYTVSKQSFIESYVIYVDNGKTMTFTSDYGKKPGKKIEDVGDTSLGNDVAYIRFTAFNGNAVEEFDTAMKFLKERGKSKLILDLRGNGGGDMDILTSIASYLTHGNGSNKFVVAKAKYKDGKIRDFKVSSGNYVSLNKLTVLASEYSASATECLIGAMMTYGNLSVDNLIVANNNYVDGEVNSTYGKGIMQTTYKSKFDTAIKLTTAYVYWPDGETCIHNKGIQASVANSCAYSFAYELAKLKQ